MKLFPRLNAFSLVLCALLSSFVNAAEIVEKLPEQYEPSDKFVFYSHGYIVEGENPTPVEVKNGWGLYDFPKVKQALADDRYTLVAIHRKKNTDPFEYAKAQSATIRNMIKNGVPANNITLIGFSRGAFITGLMSNHLADFGVNTVLLAGCGRLISRKHDDIKVYGHVLSVYEKTDKSNTCKKLKDKSWQVQSFKEIAINTGLSHGAFYRPLPQWILSVKTWMKEKMDIR